MTLIKTFKDIINDVKNNKELSNFIKEDESLYKKVIEINKKIWNLKEKDLTSSQVKILSNINWVLLSKISIFNNRIQLKNSINGIKNIAKDISNNLVSLNDFDDESQKIIKYFIND